MSGSGDPQDEGPRVFRRQELGLWGAVVVGAAFVVVAAMWWFTMTRGSGSFLSVLPSTVFLGVFVLILLRPDRIELRDSELVLRYAHRTRRIAYETITSVHGEIPSRLSWSFSLQLELQDGRTITVPSTREPLPVVHDAIAERLEPPRLRQESHEPEEQ